MRVAITARGDQLACQVDPRFGRAGHILVVDTDSGVCTAYDNAANAQAASGAGVQAGKTVVDQGVTALITGNVGPKAMQVLQAGGVQVYAGVSGTCQDALRMFQAGQLQQIQRATVDSHWS
jgi:predicted Fe-Mo cluster-binding NifX family protein